MRLAIADDYLFISNLMNHALSPYYGGNHFLHAKRILDTSLAGEDKKGFNSLYQRLWVLFIDGEKAGILNVVPKKQGTIKISPLILAEKYQQRRGIGTIILQKAEIFAKSINARQIYCTVSQTNVAALNFFRKNGYIIAGRAQNHYKNSLTEVIMYKNLKSENLIIKKLHNVIDYSSPYRSEIIDLLLKSLPNNFCMVDQNWIQNMFLGYERRHSNDINDKYKLIYVSLDSNKNLSGVIVATPKKGEPIKLMPLATKNLIGFYSLLSTMPQKLLVYGKKLYLHIVPTPDEVCLLQDLGWELEGLLPLAYHKNKVTQQWGLKI